MLAAPLFAQDSTAKRLPAVQVTREKARSPMELPLAVSSTQPDSVSPGQPHVFPEQTLSLLPGVTVANRTNPSQDARVSIRGFGARSQFGVRSLRVLRDGMPLTMADGQTPIDYLDLEAVSSVETIRGSASSLYGNASGGVIDLRSPPPPRTPVAAQIRTWFGSHGLQRTTALVGGTTESGWYQANVGRTKSDGVRAYSNQELTNRFFRGGLEWLGTQFTLIGLAMDMPTAQNPGSITRIQFDTNAMSADSASVARGARKAVDQLQVGLSASRPFGSEGELHAQVYASARQLYNPLTFAVVGIDRHTGGGSLRATRPMMVAGLRHRFTVGVDAQRLSDIRKNWANCNSEQLITAACPNLPQEQGELSLEQVETVMSFGPYVRDEIEYGRGRFTLGVRADNVMYNVEDFFTTDGRDDSGDRTMSAVSPMFGVSVRVKQQQALYVNVSTAFETPTTVEMGNKPDSSAGLNPDLKPQRSTTYEAGFKGLAFDRIQYDVAIFSTDVKEELIPFGIGAGRTAYRNAGLTRRRGAEGAVSTNVGPIALNAVITYSDFQFRDFVSAGTQYAGNAIPGIPERQAQFSAAYHHRFGFALVEWLAKDKVQVNDANAAAAPGYALVNLRAGGRAAFGKPWLSPVFGVQNALDRKYVGSVAVNAGLGKYYEPGPGRTWYAGLSVASAPW
jgi:iron complex outermembrane receptor protein